MAVCTSSQARQEAKTRLWSSLCRMNAAPLVYLVDLPDDETYVINLDERAVIIEPC